MFGLYKAMVDLLIPSVFLRASNTYLYVYIPTSYTTCVQGQSTTTVIHTENMPDMPPLADYDLMLGPTQMRY